MSDTVNPTDLSEELLGQLGLEEQPFKDHAGDGYLYSDNNLDMTSNIIMEYLTTPATTIVLTGERGVGKTTFLRKVLRLGYQRYQFCTVRVREDTRFEFIEDKIKQRWELSPANVKSPVIDLSIENYVISYLREHPHAVLIIDDAHNLESSTLDRLLTLKHRIGLACPSGMGFILAGEPSLKVKITELEESNPACTQTYQIDVRPLNKEQTESYLLHRLTTAGLNIDSPFSDDDIARIYDLSAGNIRKIHYEAARVLKDQLNQNILHDSTSAYPEQKKTNNPILVIVIAIILGIIVFGLYKRNQSSQTEQEVIAIPQEIITENEIGDTETEIMIDTPIDTPDNDPTDAVLIDDQSSSDEGSQLNAEEIAKQDPLLAESIEQVVEPDQSLPVQEENAPEDPPTHTSGEGWLKSLDPSNYTLQVVASKDIKKLEDLIKSEKLTKNYAFFPKPVNDSTYYVLVIGDYKTRQEAIDASRQLSNKLRKNEPWPVLISSIHPYLK